jgi:hypothetical protein
MKIITPILFSLTLLTSCVWDNEEEFYSGSGICDTASVSFSEDIIPILANNCYACHSNLNAPSFTNGLALEDYEDVAANALKIVGAVNHQKGFQPMPKGGSKLDPCPISLIEAWVDTGAPDN